MACCERHEKNYANGPVDLVYILAIRADRLFFCFDVLHYHCIVERGIEKRRTSAV
jgi:hypothetical protein